MKLSDHRRRVITAIPEASVRRVGPAPALRTYVLDREPQHSVHSGLRTSLIFAEDRLLGSEGGRLFLATVVLTDSIQYVDSADFPCTGGHNRVTECDECGGCVPCGDCHCYDHEWDDTRTTTADAAVAA